jgi:hypothetical protein
MLLNMSTLFDQRCNDKSVKADDDYNKNRCGHRGWMPPNRPTDETIVKMIGVATAWISG